MRSHNKDQQKQIVINIPVVEESDSDPEFRRGPIHEPEKKKVVKKRGGKKRKATEPANASGGPTKRRKVNRESVLLRNPLIDLLGVQEDDYFQKWDSENDDDNFDRELSLWDSQNEDQPGVSKKLTKAPDMQRKVSEDSDKTEEDSETEDDDDEPFDLEALMARAQKEYQERIKGTTQSKSQPSKAELRRLRRIHDPDLTETDSDEDNVPLSQPSPDSKSTNDVREKDLEEIEDMETKPNFNESSRPPELGPFFLDKAEGIQIPAPINKYLRPYQREGVKFLWDRYKADSGGILGDDMGLGKTIQVISFLSAIMKKHANKQDLFRRYLRTEKLMNQGYRFARLLEEKPELVLPPPNATWPTCLIVAPVALLPNWKSELETWGYFDVEVFESGSGKPEKTKRADIIQQFRLGRLDVAIISFGMLQKMAPFLCNLDWSVVIVDEAQRMKNPRSKALEALSSFKCIRRFALTGTAIQNNYEELWTLLDWTNPGKVGTLRQWRMSISEPLRKGQSNKATIEEQRRAQLVATNFSRKLLPNFFLRRTKDILADQLPKKLDQVAFCPLTDIQREVYRRFLATPEVKDMLSKDELCDCGSKKKRGKCCHRIQSRHLLEYITIFTKIANSLKLILSIPGDSPQTRLMNQRLTAIAFPGQENLALSMDTDAKSYCGKWNVLNGLLKTWEKENNEMKLKRVNPNLLNKVLIFTKSRKLLDYIIWTVSYEGFGFRALHGDLKRDERQASINDFQSDPDVFVFLITTLTGGVGLNLTAANKVIIFDPNWNPAHDLQAMDRAFRIGQVRDVEVYRLLAAGCIEELIYERQLYKQQQMKIAYEASHQVRYFEGVQGDKQMEGELFGIKNLFALHDTDDDTEEEEEEDEASTSMRRKGRGRVQTKIEKAHLDEQLWRQQTTEEGGDSEGADSNMFKLLLDMDAPEENEGVKQRKEAIKRNLKQLGVSYIHSNEDLLKNSAAEKAKLFPKRAKTKRESEGGEASNQTKVKAPWIAPTRRGRLLSNRNVNDKNATLNINSNSSTSRHGQDTRTTRVAEVMVLSD